MKKKQKKAATPYENAVTRMSGYGCHVSGHGDKILLIMRVLVLYKKGYHKKYNYNGN